MPQTTRIKIEPRLSADAPQPAAPSGLLRITGRTESLAERERRILKTIRSRTFGILSESDLALVRVDARRTKERDA
jgi:hypothetical protein